jgi:hypothetical protein
LAGIHRSAAASIARRAGGGNIMLNASERPLLGMTTGIPTRPATLVEALLTKTDVAAIVRVDVRTFDRLRSSGAFPAPDLFINRMPRWKAATVRDWIDGEA